MAVIFLGISCVAISVSLNPSCQENEFDFYLADLPARALLVQSLRQQRMLK
jgi:hypothetical protein